MTKDLVVNNNHHNHRLVCTTSFKIYLKQDHTLEELTFLAEQGSYVATEALAEVYEELKAIDTSYAEQAKYWKDQNNALPQSVISWH